MGEGIGSAMDEAIFVRVRIEEGEEGLLYATSPDIGSLLVAEREFPALIKEIPKVIKALLKAENEHDFDVWRTRVPGPDERAWVAIPAHEAAAALGNLEPRLS